jgi:succinyl-CoA synthetase alpha subunit
MKCDTIAEGVSPPQGGGPEVPLVVRMKGTNVELGKKILAESGLPIISADTMAEAAQKIVAAVKEARRDVHPDRQEHQASSPGHHRQDRQFHTEQAREYGNGKNCFVAGVNPEGGEDFEGMPIFDTVARRRRRPAPRLGDLRAAAGRGRRDLEAVDADLDWSSASPRASRCATWSKVRAALRGKGKTRLLLGPNCPGVITPDEIKIGIMPGHIHKPGRIGVVSRSGTLTYEAVASSPSSASASRPAVGIGGDPVNGLKHIDVLKLFNDDPETDAVIMIGEIGGTDEERPRAGARRT